MVVTARCVRADNVASVVDAVGIRNISAGNVDCAEAIACEEKALLRTDVDSHNFTYVVDSEGFAEGGTREIDGCEVIVRCQGRRRLTHDKTEHESEKVEVTSPASAQQATHGA